MAEAAPRSPVMSSRAADDPRRISMDRSSDPRYEEAPLPTPPTNSGPAPVQDSPRTAFDTSEFRERVDGVLQSDIGVITLLNRLKQSISSARDFAHFLKERSALEEKQAQGLKKLCRSTQELIRRPESRQGSFAQSYEEITSIHDRMADHGLQFANTLHQMADDLQEMASNIERGRKHWKHTGLSSEQRLQDAETAMGKAKNKYDVLAEQYDRARTGDRQSGRFGLKTKSSAQQEEDLNRKVQAADTDYATKVQAAQASRQELITSLRPQAVRAMTELSIECDSGLTLQLQKFASLNEKLLLGNGLCVSPLKNQQNGVTSTSRSLREVAQSIDNEKDFRDYILSFSNKAGTRTSDIRYEKHPALSSPKQAQPPSQPPQQNPLSFNPPMNALPNPNQSQGAPGPPVAFERGHRPTQSGQISGVTPYQPQHRDGHPMHAQQNPYTGGPIPPSHQQPPQYLGAQIPQIPPHTPITLSGTNLDQPGESPSGQPTTFMSSERLRSGSSSGPGPDMNNTNQYGEDFQPRPPPGPNQNFRPGSGPGPAQGPGPGPGLSINNANPYGDNSHPRPPQGPSQNFRSTSGPVPGPGPGAGTSSANQYRDDFQSRPPQGPSQNFRSGSQPLPPNNNFNPNTQRQFAPAAGIGQPRRSDGPQTDLPPLHPVFGLTLEDIFRRDGTAVPSIVNQCTTAVELFGLDVEGIYRISGSSPQIMELKAMFDHDSSLVDFRNPSIFNHDIASVTTLLKHFLRDLPDPLLTSANYTSFLTAARIDDDIVRRDSLHAIINDLPDPNYATLRQVTLHLHKVAEHSARNRMTPGNLAIVFGPTLMGQGGGPGGQADVRDAGWQARVVETIILNTFQIFDDDD